MIPPLLVLGLFPLLALVFFRLLPLVNAICVCIVVGYLFLPEKQGFNLPFLPTLDKDIVPALVALGAALVLAGKSAHSSDPTILRGWIPKSNLTRIFLLLLMGGATATVLTNPEPLIFEMRTIPGLRIYDIGSFILTTLMVLLPFLLARRFLGHPDTHPTLLWVLVVTGLIYSLLALYEARMSPQLHVQIYGYFQHIWNQHVRNGGFRPIVFLQHGLWVSLFFSTATLAALALFRSKAGQPRVLYLCAAGWLLVTLVITKSLGTLVITLVLAPIILMVNARLQLVLAAVVAVIVMTYPFLRGADLVPVDRISATAEAIDPARALSLKTRLRNEDAMLAKAQQKSLFGWGSWGRNRVYDEHGFSITIPDGYWIIVIGQQGWIGYIGTFGLLSIGIIGLAWNTRRYEITPGTAGLAVVLAGNMVDLIPNATLTPLTWLMAGALLGRLEHGVVSRDTSQSTSETGLSATRYTRFPQQTQAFHPAEGRSRNATG